MCQLDAASRKRVRHKYFLYGVSEEGYCFGGAGECARGIGVYSTSWPSSTATVACTDYDLDLHGLLLTDSGDVVLCDFAGSRIE